MDQEFEVSKSEDEEKIKTPEDVKQNTSENKIILAIENAVSQAIANG
jgi:hypothetical protein